MINGYIDVPSLLAAFLPLVSEVVGSAVLFVRKTGFARAILRMKHKTAVPSLGDVGYSLNIRNENRHGKM